MLAISNLSRNYFLLMLSCLPFIVSWRPSRKVRVRVRRSFVSFFSTSPNMLPTRLINFRLTNPSPLFRLKLKKWSETTQLLTKNDSVQLKGYNNASSSTLGQREHRQLLHSTFSTMVQTKLQKRMSKGSSCSGTH